MRVELKNILSDRELWALLTWNITLLVFYQTEVLRISTLIWLFYMQNVFIGLQYFLRIRRLENNMPEEQRIQWIKDSDTSVTMNDVEISPSNLLMSYVFLFGFSIFHAVYAIFIAVISVMALPGSFDGKYLAVGTGFIALNTFLSLQSDFQKDVELSVDSSHLNSLLRIPFARVFPMHLFIIAAIFIIVRMKENSGSGSAAIIFLLFIVAKTLTDVFMHVYINKTWRSERPKAFGGFI